MLYTKSMTGSVSQLASRVGPEAVELQLRRLESQDDYARAVELQRLTWGPSFKEIVPAAILKVTQRIGGVTAGAFAPDGTLVGFVYGLTGFYERRCVHWSHMLGVRPDARNLGIGRRLKEYQRALLLADGVEWTYWTFDPLVARNAHLNIARLQVEVREYVPDMYGDTGSELHAFGTDRFVVAWPVARVSANGSNGRVSGEGGILLNELTPLQLTTLSEPVLRVAVPADIERCTVEEARAWRATTRRCFLAALQQGYRVTSFQSAGDRGHYILTSK